MALKVVQLKTDREKTGELELLPPTGVAAYSDWLHCPAHHYKGVHIYDAGSKENPDGTITAGALAGLNLDIEIAGENRNAPFAKYNVTAASFIQVDEWCTYLRVRVKAISAGKVGVSVRGGQEG